MYGVIIPGFSAVAAEIHRVQQMHDPREHQRLDQRLPEHPRQEQQPIRQQQALPPSTRQPPTTTESLLHLVSMMGQMIEQQQQFFSAMAAGTPYIPPPALPAFEDASRRPFEMRSDGIDYGHREWDCGYVEPPTAEKLFNECTVRREENALVNVSTIPQQQLDTAVDITVPGIQLWSRTGSRNLRSPSISTNPAASITALLSMEKFCFITTSPPEKPNQEGRGMCSGKVIASKSSPRTMSSRGQWACFEQPRQPAKRVPKPPDKQDQHTRITRSRRAHTLSGLLRDRTENGPVTSYSPAKPEQLPLDHLLLYALIARPFQLSHRSIYVTSIVIHGLHQQRVAVNVDPSRQLHGALLGL